MVDREVRELVLTQVMLGIKTPLLTHCDNSSSFVRSLGIKLYTPALPFSPAYRSRQHLLLLAAAVPGLPQALPICQTNLTSTVVLVLWYVRRQVGRSRQELGSPPHTHPFFKLLSDLC